MTKEVFLKKITDNFPIERKSEDFLNDVDSVYNDFISDVSELEIDAWEDENSRNTTIQMIKSQVDVIKEVLNKYYEGCHGEAFSLLSSHLSINDDELLGLRVVSIGVTQNTGLYYYRARRNDLTIKTFKDMLHIPNNQREIVKTERFSVPGYPCLYLGNTVYDCWEEMGRPSFEELTFSGYKVVKDFKVYDLRKPDIVEFEKEQLTKTLMRLVYVIACQFKVRQPDKPFVPEYIIPQMLLELVITTNRKRKEMRDGLDALAWGIIYTSTHLSKDFKYREEYLENIAIPVVDTNDEHCKFLASLFEISDPLCYRYEELKEAQNGPSWEGIADKRDDLKEEYDQTKLGIMESRLQNDAEYHRV